MTKATRLVCIWDDFAHTKFGWKMILKQLAGKQFEFRRDLHLSQGLLNSIDQDYRGPNHPFLYWICHLGVGIWNPHFELVLTRPHKPSLDLIHLTNIFLSLVYEIPSNKMAYSPSILEISHTVSTKFKIGLFGSKIQIKQINQGTYKAGSTMD